MSSQSHNNSTTVNQIKSQLEAMRPFIQDDGGDVEFVSFDEQSGIVMVRLHGHCVGCPLSQITLKAGIETRLKEAVPAVKEVVAMDEEVA